MAVGMNEPGDPDVHKPPDKIWGMVIITVIVLFILCLGVGVVAYKRGLNVGTDQDPNLLPPIPTATRSA